MSKIYNEGYDQGVADVEEGRGFNSFPPPGISPKSQDYKRGYGAGYRSSYSESDDSSEVPWGWIAGGIVSTLLLIAYMKSKRT